jgi:hypothetical protein
MTNAAASEMGRLSASKQKKRIGAEAYREISLEVMRERGRLGGKAGKGIKKPRKGKK